MGLNSAALLSKGVLCVCKKKKRRNREGGRRADVTLMARHASLFCPE